MSTIAQVPLKLLLALTRGACLAAHAAGASARGHRAARLLRAAEGLCRSAAALLQLPDDASTSKGKAKESGKDRTPKKKEQPKQSEKDTDLDKDTAQKTPGAKRRRPRRRSAPAAELPPAEDKDVDFDDLWADEASAAPRPLAHQKQSSASANLPATTSAPAKTRPPSATPPNTELGWGKPGATRITDRPSSACGGVTGDAAAAPASAEPALLAGAFAWAQGLKGRPELNGGFFWLERHDPEADRWECQTGSGDWLRLRPANLAPFRQPDGD